MNDNKKVLENGLYIEFFAMKDGMRLNASTVSLKEVSTTLTNSLMDGIEKLWMKDENA